MILVLPYFLTRYLSQANYAAWVVGFQVALYVPMFGLGIHLLINRTVAHHLARQEHEQLQASVLGALQMLLVLFTLSLLFVWLAGPYVVAFSNAPENLRDSILTVWYRVGIVSCIGLFSFFFFGYFGGIQRYEWENLYKVILSSSFISAIAILGFMQGGLTPELLSNLYGVAIALGMTVLLFGFLRQNIALLPKHIRFHAVTLKSYFRGLYGTAVWQLAMLLISGFDILIVSRVDFLSVPGYSIALSFLVFLTGSISALISPCLPRFAAELGQPNHGQFKALFFIYQSRLLKIMAFSLVALLLVPNTVWEFLLKDSAGAFVQVFSILLVATSIRFITVLYSLALVSANLQHRVILSPLLEGCANLAFSIVLGYWFGATGVAIGTLIGALLCLGFHSLYNIPRTRASIPLNNGAIIFPWGIAK
jgi:O-antigen/teichoic acid export membrane protein